MSLPNQISMYYYLYYYLESVRIKSNVRRLKVGFLRNYQLHRYKPLSLYHIALAIELEKYVPLTIY